MSFRISSLLLSFCLLLFSSTPCHCERVTRVHPFFKRLGVFCNNSQGDKRITRDSRESSGLTKRRAGVQRDEISREEVVPVVWWTDRHWDVQWQPSVVACADHGGVSRILQILFCPFSPQASANPGSLKGKTFRANWPKVWLACSFGGKITDSAVWEERLRESRESTNLILQRLSESLIPLV